MTGTVNSAAPNRPTTRPSQGAENAPAPATSRAVWQRWLQPFLSYAADGKALVDPAVLMAALQPSYANDVAFAEDLLRHAKTALAAARAELKTAFMAHNDGAIYVGQHAGVLDQILTFIFAAHARQSGLDLDKTKVAIVAFGGYGRGELAPLSDLDILFLTSMTPDDTTTKTIESTLYTLWDLGLKVGHATRSVAQSIEMARQDQTVLTGLLEMRHITGNGALWKKLESAVRTEITRIQPAEFVEVKLNERDTRHQKFGATRYVVEPNIKEGKGGLRDLHTLFWIAKLVYRVDDIVGVVEQGVLRNSEARRFAAAQRFLWTVRCHLHFSTGRAEERLDFEAQMIIAPLMGFADRGGMRSVERFMKRYYLAARDVGNLTRIICATMEVNFRKRRKLFDAGFMSSQRFGSFQIKSGRVNLDEDVLFRDDPVRMFQIFELALARDADIHPHALQRITRALPWLGAETRQNAEANALFLTILTSRKNPERTLRLMNESGVIGKFLPDFGRIVAMMQFDMYHSYTVDEHTIQAVGILHDIETGGLAETAPVATEVMPEIESRRALYVAMLLHDIAKGRGGDHSILGAEVALTVCPRLGLDQEETETVSWLVRHHLLMSKMAFRYDLNDPQTIADFCAIVQSPERLKLLLVLTVADIRAVGPNIWNGWKAALMRDLYYRADAVLRGADPTIVVEGNADLARAEARAQLTDWDDASFDRHAANLPRPYWTGFDTAAHVRHARLSAQFRALDVPILVDMQPNETLRATVLTILTIDDPGLFSRIAGAVAGAGVNIAGARITTCTDGTVLDEFVLQTAANEAVKDERILHRLRTNIEQAITGELRPSAALEERWEQMPKRVRRLPVPSRVILSNKISSTHTVIEINGRDFPGLLYRITMTLANLGLQIRSSSVSTYGERVVDVFYVKDLFGLQIHNEARLQLIKNKLLASFDGTSETAS